ncbi:2815_t:CDS:2 [Dentiscutata erythropus]|uniref:2815_t:CDS:1 n=1 Tax=Dentiscutata erythropus TaxID=1348616 RepID=A0A9N8YUE2_9GLOM|nr:2815_t:CDS:2 [Dentiscutata erythropus]
MLKINLLNEKIKQLEEELEYPLYQNSQPKDSEINKEESGSLPLKRKKRKTMPFSYLLTNKESLKQLREVEEEAKKVANKKQHKKEEATQK